MSIKQREGNRWQFFMIQLNKKPGHCYFQTENCFSGSNDYTFWLMLPNNFQESRKKKSLKTTEIREVRENQLGPKYHERISIQKLTRGQENKDNKPKKFRLRWRLIPVSLRQWFAAIIKCFTKSLENEEIASLPNVLKARKILKLKFACENNISSSIVRRPKYNFFHIVVTINWNPFPLFPVWICGKMSYGLHAKKYRKTDLRAFFKGKMK